MVDPHEINPWREFLTRTEQAALADTEYNLLAPPPSKTRLGAWAEEKAAQMVEKIPESVKQQVTLAVSSALDSMRQGSTWLVNRDKVYANLGVRSSLDILSTPLAHLDEVADSYVRAARNGLTFEGMAAGGLGLVGLAADIPILYCTLFKTIQEIGLCYGFPVKPPQERIHILQTLDLGHNLSHTQRPSLANNILLMQGMIRAGTSIEALEGFLAFTVSGTGAQTQALARNFRLARQLAFDLLERKMLQSLVIVGSAIGAAANYALARDVGSAAFHLYRRRHLMELALRRSAALH